MHEGLCWNEGVLMVPSSGTGGFCVTDRICTSMLYCCDR